MKITRMLSKVVTTIHCLHYGHIGNEMTITSSNLSLSLPLKFYYCPESGQQFSSYADLIQYEEHAKRERTGIYGPAYKALRRKRNLENDSAVTEPRRTSSTLRLPKNLASYYSTTDDESSDSDSSSSSGSTDKKDQDYMPESEDSVSVDSEYCDTQIPKKEIDDLLNDDSARCPRRRLRR